MTQKLFPLCDISEVDTNVLEYCQPRRTKDVVGGSGSGDPGWSAVVPGRLAISSLQQPHENFDIFYFKFSTVNILYCISYYNYYLLVNERE